VTPRDPWVFAWLEFIDMVEALSRADEAVV
jgi:hypothetical protein